MFLFCYENRPIYFIINTEAAIKKLLINSLSQRICSESRGPLQSVATVPSILQDQLHGTALLTTRRNLNRPSHLWRHLNSWSKAICLNNCITTNNFLNSCRPTATFPWASVMALYKWPYYISFGEDRSKQSVGGCGHLPCISDDRHCMHRLWGAARARAPNNRETPMQLSVVIPSPNILVCPLNILDKSTTVIACG